MLGLVLRVVIWDLRYPVSVGRKWFRNVAWIQIMMPDGLAIKFVTTNCFVVATIDVHDNVTKVYVAVARL